VLCLERSAEEREEAAAVSEPDPLGPSLAAKAAVGLPTPQYLRALTPTRLRDVTPTRLRQQAKLTLAVAASERVRAELANSQEAATERRMAALRYAAAHRAKAATSMPSSIVAPPAITTISVTPSMRMGPDSVPLPSLASINLVHQSPALSQRASRRGASRGSR